jgi:hypothetical protein
MCAISIAMLGLLIGCDFSFLNQAPGPSLV